jgi:hypothetical protein
MRRAETNVRLSGTHVNANTIVCPTIPIARQPRAFANGPTRPTLPIVCSQEQLGALETPLYVARRGLADAQLSKSWFG